MSRIRRRADILGSSLTALCGGALALNLLLIVALLVLLAANGMPYFWQRDLLLLTLSDGTRLLGEVHDRRPMPLGQGGEASRPAMRLQMKIGNRDIGGADFRWVDERSIADRSHPRDAVVLERREWGNFYGSMVEIRRGAEVIADDPEEIWAAFHRLDAQKKAQYREIRALEKGAIGAINHALERLRLARRSLEIRAIPDDERRSRDAEIERQVAARQSEYEALALHLTALRERFLAERVVLEAAGGERTQIPVGGIVRAARPNSMGVVGKSLLYLSRLREFLLDEPRESNTEGGIFPAIFGTVLMVFVMSVAVVPLGVLAALYLREYAKQGALVRAVRIAVNNLAGVPSIVFGVFGLGFFVYLVGGTIDRLFFTEALPTPTFGTGGILWASLTLALLTVPVVIVATEEGLAAVPRVMREGSLALGATKFETTWRVVLPAAAPGILTGMILAMARAAGEVAPLMIVGMVKLAPALPFDGTFPFVHLERKFMHLGFHIYDVGFQSPNVEATKPLVFATALLLVVTVTLLNLIAIAVRNRLRRRYASATF